MRYWYEEHGGFMDITHIPYKDLDCKKCHIRSCERCHAVEKEGKCTYSTAKAKDMKTCLACHSREKLTFKYGKKKGLLDVHVAGGMGCTDCHKGEDVHGDGTSYRSMRDVGAIKASCADCHSVGEDIRAHKVHKGKLDCAACHVDNTIACMNCHFGQFLKTGKRKGNFFPMQSWLLLINYRGKVTSGTAMTLVYKGKKFVTYAPYFTHAIMAKGKSCNECHANPAMKLIKRGKAVPMMVFKDNKVVPWKGVAPVVPDKLDWVYLDKQGDKWIPIRSKEVEKIQFSEYGEPLTKEQIKKLSIPYKK
ncbi:MAG: hypothetical protein JRI46_04375 [Deltaproteobacteria bacterium]|nr:hypothetical protein [Deltaproteobacteria bacterium]